MTDNRVQRYVRPCKPDHAVLTDPTKEERETMEAMGFRSVDSEAMAIHRRSFKVGDER